MAATSQSTKEQIQQQLENDVKGKNICSENFTGTKRYRPKFTQLLANLKSGKKLSSLNLIDLLVIIHGKH